MLVLFHRLLAFAGARWKAFGQLVKGSETVLVDHGTVDARAMRKHNMLQADLLEELRLNGRVLSPSDVRQATLERSGQVSVVPAGD